MDDHVLDGVKKNIVVTNNAESDGLDRFAVDEYKCELLGTGHGGHQVQVPQADQEGASLPLSQSTRASSRSPMRSLVCPTSAPPAPKASLGGDHACSGASAGGTSDVPPHVELVHRVFFF
ncbi:hypothetical protein Zm00014a_032888 [Zea mays]|uniref:Uncharacterized protein n=1 Tax=Zea mays TaxID=4577 RepID=A0A3L6G9R0_MAIZE|nr:hypothetical protein Zm00014a_032888 [Zea mays]